MVSEQKLVKYEFLTRSDPLLLQNVGSRDRVSMWAVGDPHIRPMGATEFMVCDSPGLTTYFTSEEGLRVEFKGRNAVVRLGSTATTIRHVSENGNSSTWKQMSIISSVTIYVVNPIECQNIVINFCYNFGYIFLR